jgi:hypothetical protein
MQQLCRRIVEEADAGASALPCGSSPPLNFDLLPFAICSIGWSSANPRCISVVSLVAVIDGRGLVVKDVKDHGEPLGMGRIDKLDELGDRPLGARSLPERRIKKLNNSNSECQIDHGTIDGAIRVAVEREHAAWRRKLGRTMPIGLIGAGLFLVTTL